jgi:integrase
LAWISPLRCWINISGLKAKAVPMIHSKKIAFTGRCGQPSREAATRLSGSITKPMRQSNFPHVTLRCVTMLGRREIALPDMVVEALRDRRRAQLELRVRPGLGKPTGDDLLFLPSPRAFNAEWADVAASIGMPDFTFHALRHTHASQLIDAGGGRRDNQ